MITPTEPISLGISEATKLTGLSRGVLYRLMDSGELQSAKVAGRRLIIFSSLQNLIDRSAVEARSA